MTRDMDKARNIHAVGAPHCRTKSLLNQQISRANFDFFLLTFNFITVCVLEVDADMPNKRSQLITSEPFRICKGFSLIRISSNCSLKNQQIAVD